MEIKSFGTLKAISKLLKALDFGAGFTIDGNKYVVKNFNYHNIVGVKNMHEWELTLERE